MKQVLWVFTITILSLLLTGTTAVAQCVSLNATSTPYTQNFDTLSNTAGSTTNNLTITGWFLTETGGGARDNEQYAVDTGGSNTGDTYSYGAAGNPERALGGLRTGTLIPVFGSCYTNNTGATVTSLDVAYTGEQWRLGTAARTDQINFEYSTNATDLTTGSWTGVAALNFVTPNTVTTGAKDGNNAANQTALGSTLTGLSIANGATFWIRWTDLDASAADDGLAIDNFSLTPQANATPNLAINDVSINEGNSGTTTFSFTVSLSAPAPAGGVTFDIATAANTATTGADYVERSLTGQTIPAGSMSYTFDVSVNGDASLEPNETFFVNVTNVTGATPVDAQGTGTIVNDDADTTAPAITYTPLENTFSSNNPTLVATIADAVGVAAGGFAPRVYFRKNTQAYASNACSLSGGTVQNGTWNCVIDYSLIGGVAADSITYFVIAQDTSGNVSSNPGGVVAADVNTVTSAPGAPHLYTIGQSGIPAGNYSYLSMGDFSSLDGSVTVTEVLSIGGIVNTGSHTITLGCNATISGGDEFEYIVGNLEKNFCSAGSFDFPLGTTPDNMLTAKTEAGINPEYSPLTATVTAGTFPSSLTVTVTDDFLAGTDPAQSVSRYWNVTENGDLTADLSFTYRNADVNGSETNYQVLRRAGSTAVYPGGSVNAASNTATAPNVSNFSSWTAGLVVPTAANASIGGRVMTAEGQPIRGISVMITGGGLSAPLLTRTGTFGRYQFDELPVGQTYVVTVMSKKYDFAQPSLVFNLADSISEADFEAAPR